MPVNVVKETPACVVVKGRRYGCSIETAEAKIPKETVGLVYTNDHDEALKLINKWETQRDKYIERWRVAVEEAHFVLSEIEVKETAT
jgi:hypothetical protein